MKELIFVYNADSGLFNTLTAFAHKIMSPSTYACRLCTLTYGNFAVKKEWKHFIQQLPVASIFQHKNEFEKEYHISTNLPAIFIRKDTALDLFLSQKDINNCSTLQQLQHLITTHLALHDKHYHTYL